MSKRAVRKLRVSKKEVRSLHVVRLSLTGVALCDFPSRSEGNYVKLLFPKNGQEKNCADILSAYPEGERELSSQELEQFVKRSFTVVRGDSKAFCLQLDISLHDERGPATDWLAGAQVGDELFVVGPGPVKLLNQSADWFFLASDLTGLPGIAANLERLSVDARGMAIIEVLSAEDKIELAAPSGIEICWRITPDMTRSRLVEFVRNSLWSGERVSVWVACEFSAMRELRNHFSGERNVRNEDLYLSSYWKLGNSDEEHKIAKRVDTPPKK